MTSCITVELPFLCCSSLFWFPTILIQIQTTFPSQGARSLLLNTAHHCKTDPSDHLRKKTANYEKRRRIRKILKSREKKRLTTGTSKLRHNTDCCPRSLLSDFVFLLTVKTFFGAKCPTATENSNNKTLMMNRKRMNAASCRPTSKKENALLKIEEIEKRKRRKQGKPDYGNCLILVRPCLTLAVVEEREREKFLEHPDWKAS